MPRFATNTLQANATEAREGLSSSGDVRGESERCVRIYMERRLTRVPVCYVCMCCVCHTTVINRVYIY